MSGLLRRMAGVMRGAGVLLAGTLLTQLLMGLVYLFGARSLLPAQFGSAAASASVVLLCAAIADFGGATYTLRESAAHRMSHSQFEHWLRSKALFILAASVVVAPLGALAGGEFTSSRLVSAGLLFIGTSMALMRCVPLRAGLHFGVLTAAMVASRVPSVILVVLLSDEKWLTPDIFVGLLAAASLLEAELYRVAVKRILTRVERRSGLINPFRRSGGVGLAAVGSSVGSLDISLVRLTGGPAVAGEYAAVNRWMGPIGLLSQSVTQAIFPRLSAASEEGRARSLASGLATVAMSIPFVFTVIATAPWVTSALLGSAYQQAAPTLQLLCLAILLAMLCQPLNAALIAWSLERHAAASMIGGQFAQLAMQGGLAARFGAPGAAVGALLGQLLTLAALACALARTKASWGMGGSARDSDSESEAKPTSQESQELAGSS